MILPRRPGLAAVLSLLTALAPSAAAAQFSSEDEAPLPTVELAREGPFEVVCVDSRNQEITSFGPLFRVLRDNGREVRWQYEMEDGLTFIGRFDDLLTCRYEDKRRRKR